MARSGGASGLIAVALPPTTFAVVNATVSLFAAGACALVAAFGGLVARVSLGKPVRHSLTGLLIAVVCVSVAALTGEARAYFLLQLVVSGTSCLACLASVIARRPLAGILLNRVVGGPRNWPQLDRLAGTYATSTLVCATYSGLSCAAQIAFYLAGHTDGLALANVVDGPIWAVISIAIIVAARRAASVTRRS